MDITTVLIAIIAFLLGVLISVALYVRLLKKFVDQKAQPKTIQTPVVSPSKAPDEVSQAAAKFETQKTIQTKIAGESQCVNHEDRTGHGLCAICMEAFCEECLVENEHLHFCREHYLLFTENDWEIIETVQTNPEDAERTMYLYEFKGHLWDQEKLPTIVTTHYQINTESDQIESQVSLMVPQATQEKLALQIKSFKKPS